MDNKLLNCWEFKKCGREPNGVNEEELGTCLSATEKSLDGIHRGDNAGRACWVIAGTFCGRKVLGTFAKKTKNCQNCDFFKKVMEEEGTTHEEAQHLLEALKIVSR